MSQENVEMARRGYDAFNMGDRAGMVADFAPNFEYASAGVIPGAHGDYLGPEGYMEFVGWIWSEFEDPRAEVNELIQARNQVLATVTLRGRGKQSGVETAWTLWHLWTVEHGKIVRGQAFTDRADALEAAGLSE